MFAMEKIKQFFDELSFHWLTGLISTASNQTLQAHHAPPIPAQCSCRHNYLKLSKHWSRHASNCTDSSAAQSSSATPETGGIVYALAKAYLLEYVLLGLMLGGITLLSFSGPVLLSLLTNCAESDASWRLVAFYIALLVVSKLATVILYTQYSFFSGRLSVSISAGLKSCIYVKTLALSTQSKAQFTAGNVSNYYTVDVERIVQAVMASHNIWALPLQIIVDMVLLYQQVSYASFAGLLSILMILSINQLLAKAQKNASDMIMTAKDERMKVTSEVFQSMLIVKLNNWESSFLGRIFDIRKVELQHIWTSAFVAAISICLLWMAPCVVSVSTIAAYAEMMKNDIRASNIFTALALFRMLQDPLKNLPFCITQLYQAMSSIERLQIYYTMEEKITFETSLLDSVTVNPMLGMKSPGMVHIPDQSMVWGSRSNSSVAGNISDDVSKQADEFGKVSRLRRAWLALQHCFNRNAYGESDYLEVSGNSQHGILDTSQHSLNSSDDVVISELDSNSKVAQPTHGGKRAPVNCQDVGIELTEIGNKSKASGPLESHTIDIVVDAEQNSNIGSPTGFVLKLRSLTINPGSLVVISGSVGSGKSSVCAALLSELYVFHPDIDSHFKQSEHQSLTGTVAYASQQAWIQNMPIRDNILFGLPFERYKYEMVIEACQLLQDFAELPGYDLTPIGEKGLNLSGGQKARIGLARALYADTDVIILDDVFAALDSIVAKSVFERAILELLSAKTRLLVTHNPDIIQHPSVGISITMQEGDFIVTCCKESSSLPLDPSKHSLLKRDSIVDSNFKVSGKFWYYTELRAYLNNIGRNRTDPDDTAARQVAVASALISDEVKAEGSIDKSVYWGYFSALGGAKVLIFLAVVQTVWQALSISSDMYLSTWSQQDDSEQRAHVNRNLMIYSALSLGSGSVVMIRTMTISWCGYNAAKLLFERMLTSLMNCPMGWFDLNPSGRILNRLGDDQNKVDTSMFYAVGSMYATGFSTIGDLTAAVIITRGYLLLAIAPVFYFYVNVAKRYLAASREIQRIQAISQSPVLTYMSECNEGVYVIRAFGKQSTLRCVAKNESLIDEYSKMTYLSSAAFAWFVLRIQLISVSILMFIAIISFALRFATNGGLSSGLVGLCISYGLSISNGLQSLVMMFSWFENCMVCPERILQYVNLDPEGTEKQKNLYLNGRTSEATEPSSQGRDIASLPLPKQAIRLLQHDTEYVNRHWVTIGSIEFVNVKFRYQPSGDLVIKDLSFSIKGAEKIGIVGRTGSGKSSLSMCLFRIAELSGGKILIDGINTSDLPLSKLRSAIEIVPQNPVLFKGPVRNYLDPHAEFSDEVIWTALVKCKMLGVILQLYHSNELLDKNSIGHVAVRDSKLSMPDSGNVQAFSKEHIARLLATELQENGGNLSVGERQMLVLSRAVMRSAKILILDESTASVDLNTDREVQAVLKSEFAGSTVLTIAHRIETILHCDRILVMAAGELKEFDTVPNLLANHNGHFYALAKKAGVIP